MSPPRTRLASKKKHGMSSSPVGYLPMSCAKCSIALLLKDSR